MPTLIDYLLGAGFGIVGVLLGDLYERWATKRSERKTD